MRRVRIVKMHFLSPVRFGEPGIGLERASEYCHSDTLFSAMLNALAKLMDVEQLVQAFLSSAPPFRISSGFPFSEDKLFVKKPMLPPRVFGEADEIGRELREAEFISLQALKAWTEGMEADELVELIREDREIIRRSMRKNLIPRVQLDRLSSASGLFYIQALHFAKGSGIWFAVEGEGFQLVEMAMRQLSEDGIGGERSSGMGEFEFETDEIDLPDAGEEAGAYLLLSLWWPNEREREGKPWVEGTYAVVERRGWAFSSVVPAQVRRKSVLMFSEGSVFWGAKPRGGLADVTPESWPKNAHKLYRYGIAFTIGVRRG